MKRNLILSALAAAVVLMPALASAHPMHHRHHMRSAAVAQTAAPFAYRHDGSFCGPDPYGVYLGGQKIGRDPDPNVRQQLVYDYLYEHRW